MPVTQRFLRRTITLRPIWACRRRPGSRSPAGASSVRQDMAAPVGTAGRYWRRSRQSTARRSARECSSPRTGHQRRLHRTRTMLGNPAPTSLPNVVHVVRHRGEDRAQAQGHVGDDVGRAVHGDRVVERLLQIGGIARFRRVSSGTRRRNRSTVCRRRDSPPWAWYPRSRTAG